VCADCDVEMETKQLIDSYHEWFSQYAWHWFGVLTFPAYPRVTKAKRLFDLWISEIEKNYGTKDFRWVRVTEYGAEGINLHFHILVGGLHLRPGCRVKAMFRWQELAGEANITSFIPHRNGISYILKTVRPGQDFEIDFRLQPAAEVWA
jgi:hypothetical protein